MINSKMKLIWDLMILMDEKPKDIKLLCSTLKCDEPKLLKLLNKLEKNKFIKYNFIGELGYTKRLYGREKWLKFFNYRYYGRKQCIICQELKIKKIYDMGKNKIIYSGKNNKLWNSRICPDCNEGKESLFGLPKYHENKKCRKCNGKLELDRYFYCKKCKETLDNYDLQYQSLPAFATLG